MKILHNPIHPHEKEFIEIHFYDPNGRLIEVMSNGVDVQQLLTALLGMTDDHNLVHIEARDTVIEVCATARNE